MRRLCTTILLLALVPSLALADGPETGVVTGTVTDAQGQPLPGVTVTIEGNRGNQFVLTDDSGGYRFALLPPGSYAVNGELQGFNKAEGVTQVTAGGKSVVDLSMRLETSETITVTSEAPMVDKFNVTAGSTVSSEVGKEAAGENRTYYGVINMLPGVTNDAENGDIQGTRPQVNGAHFADSSVFIDGVDTTFARFGGSRVFIPTTATTEITMEAGGSSAEYGRVVGSSTNVIVKTGTNKFHGDALVSQQETRWNTDYRDQAALERREFPNQFQGREPTSRDFLRRRPEEEDNNATGFELSLGGPIARDKAWFFLALSENDTHNLDKTLNGDIVDASFNFQSRIAKLNFQPGAKHQLAASFIDSPSERIYFHPPSGDRFTPTPHDLSGELGSLNWNYSASPDLFLETKLATQTSNEDKFLAVGTTDVAEAIRIKQQDPRFPPNPAAGRHWPGNNYGVYLDNRDDDSWHNGWLLDNGFGLNEYPRDQANTALTWFASEKHELKFGVDWQEVSWNSNVRKTDLYSGPDFNALSPSGYDDCGLWNGRYCFYADYNPADLVVQGNESSSVNQNLALYARDRFSVGEHLTFNLGMRIEKQTNKNDVRRTVVDATEFSPRLAASYDVKGDGKMLVSLNAGRYYAQLNQQFTNQWLQEEWNGYAGQDNFLWCSETDVFLGGLPEFGGTALFFCDLLGVGYTLPLRSVRPGRMWELVDSGFWDSNIEPYYKDEVILGFEWQFSRNWAVDAKAIRWELDNMIGNTIQRDPNGEFFTLTANYKDYHEILRSLGQVPDNVIDAFEEGRKEYEALQLQLNRRFSNGWALYNNVTFSRTESTGSGAWWNNTNSTYGYDLGTILTEEHIQVCELAQSGFEPNPADPTNPIRRSAGRTVPVDCRALLEPFLGQSISTINRLGRDGVASTSADEGGALADRPIIWKTFGFKTWNRGKHNFNLGGFFTFQDGVAWGRVEEVTPLPTQGDPASIAFTNGLDIQVEPVGTRRLGSHWWVNLSGAWGFPLHSNLRGELRMEVTNVTDNQSQVNISDKGEVRRVRREFQRPRQLRILGSIRF